jgi:hypothetical protein
VGRHSIVTLVRIMLPPVGAPKFALCPRADVTSVESQVAACGPFADTEEATGSIRCRPHRWQCANHLVCVTVGKGQPIKGWPARLGSNPDQL